MQSHSPNYEANVTSTCSNIVKNGGFENGWAQPWTIVDAQSSGLSGWNVPEGNVEFGDYRTFGHCNKKSCAHGGKAFLDMCGSTRGAIAHTLRTVPDTAYVLKLAYHAHASCSSSNTVIEMDVLVDGKSVKSLRHCDEGTWDLNWAAFSYEFKASGDSVRLEFKSINSG